MSTNANPLVFLSQDIRPQALYIAGNPGSGKSSLIQRMVLHDLRAKPKRGVCVIDPTGDLVNTLIHWIPEERVEDTIYFDTDHPVPIDFFSYHHPGERQVLIDQLLDVFHLDNAPVSRPRLLKILVTLLDANDNPKMPDEDRATFLDIQTFIEDPPRRRQILSYCPQMKSQWPDAAFAKLSDYSSITERMAPFTLTPALRTMLAEKRPHLNIWDVMQNNQILLVNLKDTPTDAFIGSLIASKFQQATFGRRYIPNEEARVPYYLYIDECNTLLEYSAKDFEKILLRARKYRLCLTLANQIPEDLPEGIRKKLGTIGSLVLFNLDPNNAHLFKNRIAPYRIEDLVNLPKFSAICRGGNEVLLIETRRFLGMSPTSYAERIRENTLKNYGPNASSAESGSKRGIEKNGCGTPHEAAILRQSHENEPQPTGRPKGIPSHRSKTRGA